jgi:hypothetical protein
VIVSGWRFTSTRRGVARPQVVVVARPRTIPSTRGQLLLRLEQGAHLLRDDLRERVAEDLRRQVLFVSVNERPPLRRERERLVSAEPAPALPAVSPPVTMPDRSTLAVSRAAIWETRCAFGRFCLAHLAKPLIARVTYITHRWARTSTWLI